MSRPLGGARFRPRRGWEELAMNSSHSFSIWVPGGKINVSDPRVTETSITTVSWGKVASRKSSLTSPIVHMTSRCSGTVQVPARTADPNTAGIRSDDAGSTASDCGGAGNSYITIGDSGKRCTAACTTDDACPDGFRCRSVASGNTVFAKMCVPSDLQCD